MKGVMKTQDNSMMNRLNPITARNARRLARKPNRDIKNGRNTQLMGREVKEGKGVADCTFL